MKKVCILGFVLALTCAVGCSNIDSKVGVSSVDAPTSSLPPTPPMLGENDGKQYFLDEQAILQNDKTESLSSKMLYKASGIYGVNIDGEYLSLPCSLAEISELGFEPIAPEYEQMESGVNDIVVSNDGVVLHLVVYKTVQDTGFAGEVIGVSIYSSSTDTAMHNASICGIGLGDNENVLTRKLGAPTSKSVNQNDITGRTYIYANPDNPSQYFIYTTGGGVVVQMEVASMEGGDAYGLGSAAQNE